MSEKYGLSEKTIQTICSVFARHSEIEQAILFGSRAKGTYRRGSDIDLVLKGTGMSQRVLNDVSSELDDLPVPYEFSLLLDEELIDPAIRAHVSRVGLVFYEPKLTTLG